MRGVLAVAMIALGTALPVLAITGAHHSGGSDRRARESGVIASQSVAVRSDAMPESAMWALMIGGFGLAGALRRPRA